MRPAVALLLVAAVLAGCGTPAPSYPVEPPPPIPVPDPGNPTLVEGVRTGMDLAAVVGVLGDDYRDVVEIPGQPDMKLWIDPHVWVWFIDGKVSRAEPVQVVDVEDSP